MIFVLESVNNPIMRKRKTSMEQVQGARWALLLGDREQKLEAGRGAWHGGGKKRAVSVPRALLEPWTSPSSLSCTRQM